MATVVSGFPFVTSEDIDDPHCLTWICAFLLCKISCSSKDIDDWHCLCEIYAFFYATSLAHLKTWIIDIALLCESVHSLMQHLLLQPGKRNSAWWCALQMHCSISPRLLCVGQGMRKGLFWEWGSNKSKAKAKLDRTKILRTHVQCCYPL
jgi:hypothetical protein